MDSNPRVFGLLEAMLDSGQEERARWRRQAREWLQADLKVWAKLLDINSQMTRNLAKRMLEHWQVDPDLAGLRDSEALTKLPPDERQKCRTLTRLTRSRLLALGVEPARIDQGIFLGISDPAKKSSRKLGLIEDDIGMLWITPEELVYQGDNDAFRIRREQRISIERVADAGSISAYFGNVHIILTFTQDSAAPRRVRLHPESALTMTGIARASDHLANELERWKGEVPAAATKV